MKAIPLILLAIFMAASPARAEDPKTPLPNWDESQEMLEDGAKRVIGALQLFLSAIPQYEMPEILPNGDILIRRKHLEKEPPATVDRDRT